MAGLSLKGTLTLEDGESVEILVDDDDVSIAWGGDTAALGRTVELREAIQQALSEEVRRVRR